MDIVGVLGPRAHYQCLYWAWNQSRG